MTWHTLVPHHSWHSCHATPSCYNPPTQLSALRHASWYSTKMCWRPAERTSPKWLHSTRVRCDLLLAWDSVMLLEGSECWCLFTLFNEKWLWHTETLWHDDVPYLPQLFHGRSESFKSCSLPCHCVYLTVPSFSVHLTVLLYACKSNLFDVHCCHMGTATKHPVLDWVKPSFVIFDIRTLWRSGLSVRVSWCQKLQMTA